MIPENITSYHLYQSLTLEERKEITEQLSQRERRGGKPSQVKALHLALGKGNVLCDKDLYGVLPEAAQWKDIAQTKRKLARTYLDLLVYKADHPSAVARRKMTELEQLAKRSKYHLLMYHAEETIEYARKHELYREAVDAYYLWNAARLVTQRKDGPFSMQASSSMVQGMWHDAIRLNHINTAEWFYHQSRYALNNGDQRMARLLIKNPFYKDNLSDSEVYVAYLKVKARYGISLLLGRLNESVNYLEQLSDLIHDFRSVGNYESMVIEPYVHYSLGFIVSSVNNDERILFKAIKRLTNLVDGKTTSYPFIRELHKSLLTNLNLQGLSSLSALTNDGRRDIAHNKDRRPQIADKSPIVFINCFFDRNWELAIKAGHQLLMSHNRKDRITTILWVGILIAHIEISDVRIIRNLAKSALRDMGSGTMVDSCVKDFLIYFAGLDKGITKKALQKRICAELDYFLSLEKRSKERQGLKALQIDEWLMEYTAKYGPKGA